MRALLALEDGKTFECRSFTGSGEARGEVVFNTGMTGYQEVVTDPSYRGQMVTMTYPLIGNYGVNPEDVESDRVQVAAFLVKEYQPFPSNHRCRETLAEYLQRYNILGVEGLDTRALTIHIRQSGAMRGFISTETADPDWCVEQARAIPGMAGRDLAKDVSSRVPYYWSDGGVEPIPADPDALDASVWRSRGKFRVAAFDYGIKYNILRRLDAINSEVIVLPATSGPDAVKAMAPDGVFLSNGPGDPEPVTYAIETVKALLGHCPMFGICLGHQILGLALGGTTFKLKFGHRGANQPVKHLTSGRIEITSQNHGFAVDAESLKNKDVDITHINLNDNTLEGFRRRSLPVFAVQYHPEASPGPHDARYLFDYFADLMKNK